MLPLETKQSGGKLLPHSDLRGGGDVSRRNIAQHTKRDEDRTGGDHWGDLGVNGGY